MMRRATPSIAAAAALLLAAFLSSCAGFPPASGGRIPPEEAVFDAAALEALTAEVTSLGLSANHGGAAPERGGPSILESLRALAGRSDLDKRSRLAVLALSGEASLSSGDASSARSALASLDQESGWSPASKKADPGALLRASLAPDRQKRLALLEEAAKIPDSDPRLGAEAALLSMEANGLDKAFALFDASLPRMGESLRALYAPYESESRRRAELSAGASSGNAGSTAPSALVLLSAEKEVSFGRLARALYNIKPALFSPELRAAPVVPGTALLIKDLASSGIFPADPGMGRPRTGLPEPGAGLPAPDEGLTRREAALIFFILYQTSSAKPMAADRYSQRYATPGLGGRGKGRSPVPDLEYGSPGFDACLAMVELEAMELPDGKNFRPEGILGGMDAASALKKLGY